MAKQCKIILKDEVNVEIKDLEPSTRRKLNEKFKFFIPSARFAPAYKYGRWDGKVSYFALNGNTYYQLLEEIIPELVNEGYVIDDNTFEDHRNEFDYDIEHVTESYLYDNFGSVWPDDHMLAGEPMMLRDYQVTSINKFIDNPQAIEELCTSFGKTILTAVLSHITEKFGKSLVIVPNKDLVKQTYKDYANLGLDVGMYYGDVKEIGHTHTITTWQSLEVLRKNFKQGKISVDGIELSDIIDGVCTVIVDEVHGAKGEILKDLLTNELATVPFRWGVTGTLPKEKIDRMTIRVSLGECVHKVKARELMDLGYLSKCNIKSIQVQDFGEYNDYHEEKDFLISDVNHIEWLSLLAKTIAKESGNVLVLFDRIETGDMLKFYLPGADLVNGAVKGIVREETYSNINNTDGNIILATMGVAAVGVNIPRLFNVILIEPGKSPIRVIQSIGRGIRKAKDKNEVTVYDVSSTLKYSEKHMKERIKLYDDAEYEYEKFTVDIEDDIIKKAINLIPVKTRRKKK